MTVDESRTVRLLHGNSAYPLREVFWAMEQFTQGAHFPPFQKLIQDLHTHCVGKEIPEECKQELILSGLMRPNGTVPPLLKDVLMSFEVKYPSTPFAAMNTKDLDDLAELRVKYRRGEIGQSLTLDHDMRECLGLTGSPEKWFFESLLLIGAHPPETPDEQERTKQWSKDISEKMAAMVRARNAEEARKAAEGEEPNQNSMKKYVRRPEDKGGEPTLPSH